MALSAGDTTCVSGTMAGAIYDQFVSAWGDSGDGSVGDDALREMAAAIAEGVVSHITAEAEVAVTIATTDDALQRDPATNDDTRGPSVDRTIAGVIT